MKMPKLSRSLATVLSVAAFALLGMAPTAHAGQCDAFGCSEWRNRSGLHVTAFKNWTCETGTTGTANASCGGGSSMYVNNNGGTPPTEDWDAMRVDAGYCYKIDLWVPGKSWTMRYDRRGMGATYVKVENWGLGTVVAQSSTSCP